MPSTKKLTFPGVALGAALVLAGALALRSTPSALQGSGGWIGTSKRTSSPPAPPGTVPTSGGPAVVPGFEPNPRHTK